MAEPHPKVLNLTSSITPVESLTLICNLITSPHAGAPTRPVPTLGNFLSNEPNVSWMCIMLYDLGMIKPFRYAGRSQNPHGIHRSDGHQSRPCKSRYNRKHRLICVMCCVFLIQLLYEGMLYV